jgi:hypothetical protein
VATGIDQNLLRQGQHHFRASLADRYEASAQRLMEAYERILKSLGKSLGDLVDEQVQSTLALQNNPALERLLREYQAALEDFARLIGREAKQLQLDGFDQSGGVAEYLFRAVGITVRWNMPSIEMMKQLINYVDDPIFQQRLSRFPLEQVQAIRDLILADAALGKGPVATARHIVKFIGGVPLHEALKMVRTVQIYGARRGMQQIYIQNSDIVAGWWWGCALDGRVCPSCLAMHGMEFSVAQLLNDHYSGRCVMVPKTRLMGDRPIQRGEDWFRGQPPNIQQRIMGGARYRAWKDGAVQIDQMSVIYLDDLYGPMRHAPSLRQMIGDAAAREYYAA